MAYIHISPIKEKAHLQKSLNYINNKEKTNDGLYTDGFKCSFKFAAYDFAFTRQNARVQKGNNLAWHIIQSFSAEDEVTPEKALEIGKKLMKRMYPDYQYVIATHIDREHIHNHIIMCSVNFKDFHKLNSNKTSLAKMQNINDDLCRENGLSVIDRKERPLRNDLRKAIDEAINNADDFVGFIAQMQSKGYNIKMGKHISFKNDDMKRFMRSSTIGIDYTEAGIKNRINSINKEPRFKRRNKYDDKVIVKSKRKILKAEMDASLKRAKSYEEFLEDMRRKKFEVKEGKHLAFKGERQQRFIRSESLGYKYSEEVLRFRFEFREEFEDMEAKEIGRVVNKKPLEGGLYEWAAGYNMQVQIDTDNWVEHNLLNGDREGIGYRKLYAIFIKEYYKQKERIGEQQAEVEKVNTKMRDIVNFKNAITKYYSIHLMEGENFDIRKTVESLPNGMKNQGLEHYANQAKERSRCVDIINAGIEKYGTMKFAELDKLLNELKEEKHKEQTKLTKMKLDFENWDNVKFNYESEWGGGLKEEDALAFTDEQLQEIKDQAARQREKNERKRNSILGKLLY